MASCSAAAQYHSQPRKGEKNMADKLNKWADEGLLPSRPTWNRQNPNADPVQCGKYRPDFVFETELGVVISEYDEHQHTAYKRYCELSRMLEVSHGYNQRPVHWIRYNPDFFSMDGRTDVDSETRDTVHLEHLQSALKSPDYEHFITIEYLFYRPMFGRPIAMVQKFQFSTSEDYIAWIDSIVPPPDSSLPSHSTKMTKIQEVSSTTVSPEKNFVLTYGKGHGYITYQTFRDVCYLNIDECHTTSDNVMIYSYLHFKDRVHISVIEKAMQRLNSTHGVVHCTVFGYESVGSSSKNNDIENHIAFKMLVDHMNTNNPSFVHCTDGISIVSKGILKRHKDCTKQVIEFLSNKHSGRTYLANHVRDMQAQIEQLSTKTQELSNENEKLKEKCIAYKEKIILQASNEMHLNCNENDLQEADLNGTHSKR